MQVAGQNQIGQFQLALEYLSNQVELANSPFLTSSIRLSAFVSTS